MPNSDDPNSDKPDSDHSNLDKPISDNPTSDSPISDNPVIFYDGVCGLCNRLVKFVLKRDTAARFRFASLQSPYAVQLLQGHGLDGGKYETVFLIPSASQPVIARSDAVIFILRALGSFWSAVAFSLKIVPIGLRDWGYRVVAGNRYRVFGKYAACPTPEEKYKDRFLDL